MGYENGGPSTAELFKARLGIEEPSDEIEIRTIEEDNPTEIAQKNYDAIKNHAGVIGRTYQESLPELPLEEAFVGEVDLIAKHFNDNTLAGDETYFNALSELELVTKVDAAFASSDLNHIIPFGNTPGREHRQFKADLEDVSMRLQSGSTYYEVTATNAVWNFDRNGVRLVVYYIDPMTGESKTVKAQMDFHTRNSGEYKDKIQAALDLKGEKMTQAFNKSNKDYHRGEVLPGVLKERADFEKLRQGRIQVSRSLSYREFNS